MASCTKQIPPLGHSPNSRSHQPLFTSVWIFFPCPGAAFVHNAEVTFYPGEERVWITQTAEGLDSENYLIMKTNIQGQVPAIPANFMAHIPPYKELYHYSDSGTCNQWYLPNEDSTCLTSYHSSEDYMSSYMECSRTLASQMNLVFFLFLWNT